MVAQVDVGKSKIGLVPQKGLVRLDDRTTRGRVGTSQLTACSIIQIYSEYDQAHLYRIRLIST